MVPMFLGDNLLPYLVLAFGGAMAVGTLLALVRPPQDRPKGDTTGPAPMMRSILFIAAGAVAAIWALASLLRD
jgi:hypothetical protein